MRPFPVLVFLSLAQACFLRDLLKEADRGSNDEKDSVFYASFQSLTLSLSTLIPVKLSFLQRLQRLRPAFERIVPANMTWLHQLNPTPYFPAYTGKYKVGTVDVEIPVSELESPCTPPLFSSLIPTVSFRVFYPCEPESEQRYTRWIPSPQRGYVSAFARFVGVHNIFSQLFS